MTPTRNEGQLTDEEINDFVGEALSFKLNELYPDRDNNFKTQLACIVHQRIFKPIIPVDLAKARFDSMNITTVEEHDRLLAVGVSLLAALVGLGSDITEPNAVRMIEWYDC